MSRGKELIKNTAILTVGKVCTQFVGIFMLPLYTTILEPAEYGIVDLFNTSVTLLIPIVNWQMDQGLFRFILDCRNNEKEQKVLLSTTFIANISQVGVYLILFILVQPYIHSTYKIFLAIDVVLNVLNSTLMQFARGRGHNGDYAFASFISASSTVLLNVLLIAVVRMGAYGLFYSGVAAKILCLIYLLISQKVWCYFRPSLFSIDAFKKIMKYSFPLIPNSLSWWVVTVSDRTIITIVLGVAINGIYSVANKFSSIYITFYNFFNMSWTESASLHINDEDREQYFSQTINTMFCLFASICLEIIVVMPFVFPTMINEKYVDAYKQIPILMLAVLFQMGQGLYSVIYVAKKKSTEIAKTSIMSAIINIVIDIALIHYIGLYAASISTLIAYSSMFLYRYIDVKKYIKAELDGKICFSMVVITVGLLIAYYINLLWLNIIAIIIITGYALWVNHELLLVMTKTMIEMINEKRGKHE